jgi:NAD(P)-dependent dehydrogenase (short-subunit alcohol dehydrogenase family)
MRILITGAGRAIGYATAVELADRGHSVLATARDPSIIVPHAGIESTSLDVTDAASIAACVEIAGEVDVLVNNAALSGTGPLEDFPLERLRTMFETNTIGALAMVQALSPGFKARRSGVIVNVSSIQGQVGSPLAGPYCMTKFALESLSETLHYELGHFGIRTVIIEPGYIAPGMKQPPTHRGPDEYDELWEQWEGTDNKVTGPTGRMSSEDAAGIIADPIEDPSTPLRVRVGADAEAILETRKRLDDAEFEQIMRSTLSLDW